MTDLATVVTDPVPDTSREAPLVRRLVEQFGARWVTPATLDAFTARRGDQVLYFSGDPVRFSEVLDVAVVLPELQKAFPGRFGIGVVPRDCEDELARRYGVRNWPSLLFLRDGRFVAIIAGMQDWTDYLAQVADALARPATRAPIALHDSTGASAGCH